MRRTYGTAGERESCIKGLRKVLKHFSKCMPMKLSSTMVTSPLNSSVLLIGAVSFFVIIGVFGAGACHWRTAGRDLTESSLCPATSRRRRVGQTLALRETINANQDKVRALADGVLFEFGPSRQRDLELRSQIRGWQPDLRTLFLMRIASLKYRLRLPGFENAGLGSPSPAGVR